MSERILTEAEKFSRSFSRVYAQCKMQSRRDPSTGETVSHRQAAILDALCDEHPKYVGDVAARLGITAATLSLTLDRMTRAGWIRRFRDEGDRRKVRLLLTEHGARLQKHSEVLDPVLVEKVLAALDPARRAGLLEGIVALAAAIAHEEHVDDALEQIDDAAEG